MEQFVELFSNVANFTWQQLLMIAIGATLIYLAIKKEMEPTLLLPMGFGAILVNLPFVNTEAIETLFNAGIATELFPLLLFIGIGAMIDFGPLLSNPKMFLFGAGAVRHADAAFLFSGEHLYYGRLYNGHERHV